ncbi:MAG: hypothetical protein U0T74_08720 [Chitinophagales bacterium]
MKRNAEILKELNTVAPVLAAIERKNFYSVPEGYFDTFKLNLLDLIDNQTFQEELKTIAPDLLKLDRVNSLEVPSPYFHTFSAKLLKKIRHEELAEIAPQLAGLQKNYKTDVPANYFASFPQRMIARINAEQKTTELSGTPVWLIQINAMVEDVFSVFFKPKYAIAFAGLASTILVAVMFFTQVEQQCSDLDCKMAKLSDQELSTYLDAHTDEVLDEVFENTDLNEFTNEQSSDGIKEALSNLTDEELNNAILD